MSTQTSHPWRASLRTGGTVFISALFFLAAAAPIVVEFTETYFPGTPAAAVIASVAGIVGGVSVAVNRIILLPAFDALLTKLGLGPAPKKEPYGEGEGLFK